MHQDLKNLRTTNPILPESLVSRYRPSPHSTAVVLWKPPTGLIPDVITSTWKKAGRSRCYSETTTATSPAEENDGLSSPKCVRPAEAPELSASLLPPPAEEEEEDMMLPVANLQRRNSAPEMSEPQAFVDEGSMEL